MDRALTIASFALGFLSLMLHFIAPKTKTKVDDEAEEVVDAVKDAVDAAKPKPPGA